MPNVRFRGDVFFRFSIRQFATAVLALLAIGATANAGIDVTKYSLTDLGTLPGFNQSVATSINNKGQVVGSSADGVSTTHAFLYSSDAMMDLGTLAGDYSESDGINNLGQVVGYSTTNGEADHAFLFSDGQLHDLGTLGGNNSIAYAINDSGKIVGGALPADAESHAFIFGGTTLNDLGTLGGKVSWAHGINAKRPDRRQFRS